MDRSYLKIANTFKYVARRRFLDICRRKSSVFRLLRPDGYRPKSIFFFTFPEYVLALG